MLAIQTEVSLAPVDRSVVLIADSKDVQDIVLFSTKYPQNKKIPPVPDLSEFARVRYLGSEVPKLH